MRVIPFIFYLFLIAFFDVVLEGPTTFFDAAINVPAIFVLIVAIYKPEIVVVWFGFGVGVVLSAGNPMLIGWHALALAAMAFAAFQVKERLNLASVYSKVYLIFGGILVHNLMTTLIEQPEGIAYLFWTVLTGAAYSAVFGWLFFLFKEGHFTISKIRSLF